MPPDLNIVLADCERQAKKLVEEIDNYRAISAISEQTAKSLDNLCIALDETNDKIQPFTAVFARRILLIFGLALLVNFGLLTAILVMLLYR